MLNINYNFDGQSNHEIFNISPERAVEIAMTISKATVDIVDNRNDYFYDGIGENVGMKGLWKGRILKRLLSDFADPNEQAMALISYPRVCAEIMGYFDGIVLREALAGYKSKL